MLTSSIIAALLIILAYLLGSIPTGYLVGLYVKGIDIREYGSGSTGATNVLRNVGKGAAITVLLIDLLKGMLATGLIYLVYFIGGYFIGLTEIIPLSWEPWLVTAAGLMAVVGHSKSIWINFSGGKSVATSLGVLFVMSPLAALGTIGVFALVLALSRFVSLSSILGAIAVNLLMILLQQPVAYLVFTSLAALYVIGRHQTNISRLLSGTEPRLGKQISQSETAPKPIN